MRWIREWSTGERYLFPNIPMTLTHITHEILSTARQWAIKKTIGKNWKTHKTATRNSNAHFMHTHTHTRAHTHTPKETYFPKRCVCSEMYTMFQFTKQQLWAHWLFVIPFGFKFQIAYASVSAEPRETNVKTSTVYKLNARVGMFKYKYTLPHTRWSILNFHIK